jgi:hypothetical protein
MSRAMRTLCVCALMRSDRVNTFPTLLEMQTQENVMSEETNFLRSIGAMSVSIRCMDADVKGLPEAHLSALHLCKAEMMAALFRCYAVVGQAKTDQIVSKYIKVSV